MVTLKKINLNNLWKSVLSVVDLFLSITICGYQPLQDNMRILIILYLLFFKYIGIVLKKLISVNQRYQWTIPQNENSKLLKTCYPPE